MAMTLQRGKTLAATHLPQAYCLVPTATGKSLPSGLKATDLTLLVWPCRVLRHWLVLTSHKRTV